ncbi:Protein of unknown function [Lactobacillus helveticus CIRM-BIA 101]|nr:Protein of unknown function [Lactobacillus helveticus CIRM-BIA 101]
MTVKKLEIAAM